MAGKKTVAESGEAEKKAPPQSWEEAWTRMEAFVAGFNNWSDGVDSALNALEARLGMIAPDAQYDIMKIRDDLTQLMDKVGGLMRAGAAPGAMGAIPAPLLNVNEVLYHASRGYRHVHSTVQRETALAEGFHPNAAMRSVEAAAREACKAVNEGKEGSAKQVEAMMRSIMARGEETEAQRLLADAKGLRVDLPAPTSGNGAAA